MKSVAFALQKPANLYRGPLTGYSVDIHTVPEKTALPERDASSTGTKSRSKAAAYSYLSVVDGVPMRHASWTECERRVKGQSNARYKKATSAADEAAILRGWGVALR
jgi:ribonuclease HI